MLLPTPNFQTPAMLLHDGASVEEVVGNVVVSVLLGVKLSALSSSVLLSAVLFGKVCRCSLLVLFFNSSQCRSVLVPMLLMVKCFSVLVSVVCSMVPCLFDGKLFLCCVR